MSHQIGRRVLLQEAESLLRLADRLGSDFETAVDWLAKCEGRIVCCGIGKSGHIARKTAGTLSSTGTPSLFLHAAEAVHGDLGMIRKEDIVLLYTHSGETDEVVRLFPAIKAAGARTILITARPDSSAGRSADLILDTGVTEEACTHNLAPTTSTTVMLALSDALAIAAMEAKGFSREDFARFHPSGVLGKRLLLRVTDVMRPVNEIATVSLEDSVLEVTGGMTRAGVGVALVTDGSSLLGLIAESDLRRHYLSGGSPVATQAREIMNSNPYTIDQDLLAVEALEILQNAPKQIGEIPVLLDGKLAGLIVLKDLVRSGIL